MTESKLIFGPGFRNLYQRLVGYRRVRVVVGNGIRVSSIRMVMVTSHFVAYIIGAIVTIKPTSKMGTKQNIFVH